MTDTSTVTLELTGEEAHTVLSALGCYSHAWLVAIYQLKTPYRARGKVEDERAIELGHRLRELIGKLAESG